MDRFEQLAAKYLDQGLSPVEGQELATHLRANSEATKQFLLLYRHDQLLRELHRREDLAAVDEIMTEIRREEGAFVGSVMRRVHEEQNGQRRSHEQDPATWIRTLCQSWLIWAGAAATVVLVLMGLVLSWPGVGKPMLLVTAPNSVTIERGRQTILASSESNLHANDLLTLRGTNGAAIIYPPEKTRLDLTPGTTLRLMDWAHGKRFELRHGQIAASVARQRLFKPLRVGTSQAEARVLGTQLTLSATTNRTTLAVSEGKVRLTSLSDGKRVDVAKDHYAMAGPGVELRALPKTGNLLREIWTDIPGREVNDLLDDPHYPNTPTRRDLLQVFEIPVIQTNNYACRLIGYIHPPVTGEYTFWIAGGGRAALSLSLDENSANKARIASTFGGLPREWEAPHPDIMGEFQQPQSQAIRLVAGRRCFIEAVQKTGAGSCHLAVAWKIPGGEREVISGEFLSPYEPGK